MLRTRTKLTPEDHGRRMSLKEFEPADWQEGYLYELARGVVVVSDVPGFAHMRMASAVRRQLTAYQLENPDEVYEVLGTMECKILVEDLASERHPDVAVFKQAPKSHSAMWKSWVPELVVEVVSSSSEDRDYVEKREEYLARGIEEYWIVDGIRGRLLVLRLVRGKWTEQFLKSGSYETKLLPGFRLDIEKVFAAGRGK